MRACGARPRCSPKHGYGVLAIDMSGHGESGGRTNRLAWQGTEDIARRRALPRREARRAQHRRVRLVDGRGGGARRERGGTAAQGYRRRRRDPALDRRAHDAAGQALARRELRPARDVRDRAGARVAAPASPAARGDAHGRRRHATCSSPPAASRSRPSSTATSPSRSARARGCGSCRASDTWARSAATRRSTSSAWSGSSTRRCCGRDTEAAPLRVSRDGWRRSTPRERDAAPASDATSPEASLRQPLPTQARRH